MIFIINKNTDKELVNDFAEKFKVKGFQPLISYGTEYIAVGLLGNTAELDLDQIVQTTEFVEYGKRITEPFKLANRKFNPEDTRINIKGRTIGKGTFNIIAGPCSIESEEQMMQIAISVKRSGATMLRGGAFKPRSSPYSFQGIGKQGLEFLIKAGKVTGLPIVTEIMDITQLELFNDVDVIQVGARNMQNFNLLKELGKSSKTILLKRGLCNTLEELLMSAEYIMASGNPNVILCERGIRTFETYTRNTLDIAAVPILKRLSHLPVIVAPSHAAGQRALVPILSKTAIVAGADGIMIETHNNPIKALCDGAQSLDLEEFDKLMMDIEKRVTFEMMENRKG